MFKHDEGKLVKNIKRFYGVHEKNLTYLNLEDKLDRYYVSIIIQPSFGNKKSFDIGYADSWPEALDLFEYARKIKQLAEEK